MEPERSLRHSQVPATSPYPDPDSIHWMLPPTTSWASILILFFHRCLCLPSGQFPSRFPTTIPEKAFPLPILATWPTHLILLDLITRKILGEQYRSPSSSICSFPHSPITSSLLGQNILLNTLLSNTLSLRSSLNVSDHVPHPHKTTCENIVL